MPDPRPVVGTVAATSDVTRVHFYLAYGKTHQKGQPRERILVIEHSISEVALVRTSRLELCALQGFLGHQEGHGIRQQFEWQSDIMHFLRLLRMGNPTMLGYSKMNAADAEERTSDFPLRFGHAYQGPASSIHVYRQESDNREPKDTIIRVTHVAAPYVPPATAVIAGDAYKLPFVDVQVRTKSERLSERVHDLFDRYVLRNITSPSRACDMKAEEHHQWGIKNSGIKY